MSDYYEDGEPPFGQRHLRPYYAEHMNTLAQRGVTGVCEPPGVAKRDHLHKRRLAAGLSPEERAEAERIWSKLPRWDDVAREPRFRSRRCRRTKSEVDA